MIASAVAKPISDRGTETPAVTDTQKGISQRDRKVPTEQRRPGTQETRQVMTAEPRNIRTRLKGACHDINRRHGTCAMPIISNVSSTTYPHTSLTPTLKGLNPLSLTLTQRTASNWQPVYARRGTAWPQETSTVIHRRVKHTSN